MHTSAFGASDGCTQWLGCTQCPSRVHPHVLGGRGRDCGLLGQGWCLVLWSRAASEHLLHPSPGSRGSGMHTVSRISTTEPSEESTTSAVPLRRHAASSKPSVHRSAAPSPAPVGTQGPTEISGCTVPGSIPITHYRT